MAKASMVLRMVAGTIQCLHIERAKAPNRWQEKKIQELHAKEVGVGNPSEERASS